MSKTLSWWTAKASKGEMYNTVGSAIAGNIYVLENDVNVFDDVRDGKYGLMVSVDGARQRNKVDDYFKKNSNAAAGKVILEDGKNNVGETGNGVLTELYMDDDGNVTIAMINTYLVKANSDYNTVNERVSIDAVDLNTETNKNLDVSFLPTYIEQEDFDVSGVKEGDYLLVTVSFGDEWGKKGSNNCTLESVTPATVQTGAVTEYTEKSDVTVGGTKYSYNKVGAGPEKEESFTINSDATLILDSYGYIMCVDEAFTSNSFVYVNNFGDEGTFGNDPVADAYFTDGTAKTIHLSKVTVSTKTGTNINTETYSKSKIYDLACDTTPPTIPTGWYTFTGSGNSLYTLKTPELTRYDKTQTESIGFTAGDDIIKNGSVTFMKGSSLSPTAKSLKANDKTIFVVKDDKGDVRTYTGIANAPDVKFGATQGPTASVKISWLQKNNSSYASFVFVNAFNTNAKVNDVGGTVDYMFVLKSTENITHVDGLTYKKFKVVIDGKEEERWVADDGDPVEAGKLYKSIREDSHGRISGVTEIDEDGSRQWHHNINGGEVKRDGNALTIVYSVAPDAEINLLANSKSNINLVLAKDSGNAAHKEYADGDDYVLYQNVSASFVSGILGDYENLSGAVYLVRADDNSEVIDTLWIYVNKSTDPDNG